MPWILAYTGARVNEITQLRKQDVKVVDGIHVLKITPEAGGNKTNTARLVPIHPHLVEMGFLEFVEKQDSDALFYNGKRTRGGKESKAPYKKVGERLAAWVRKLGVDEEGVKPNHGWRHRMSSILIGMRVPQRDIDAILGHKGLTYGKVGLGVKKDIVDRIPWIVLDPEPGAVPPTPAKRQVLEKAE